MNEDAILTTVTFTGADDKTDFKALIDFQGIHSIAEWGILIWPGMEGQPRYPTSSWVDRFTETVGRTNGNTALHLCGDAINQFLSQDKDMWNLTSYFNRVQLNIFQGKRPVSPDAVDNAAQKFKQEFGCDVIVPMNPKNRVLVDQLTNPDIQILFDASGGKGHIASDVPVGLKDRFCGWAGGMNPDNVSEQADKIEKAAQGPYWIDMETGVRTDDVFDLAKCRAVLKNIGVAI